MKQAVFVYIAVLVLMAVPVGADDLENIPAERLNFLIKHWSMSQCKAQRDEDGCLKEIVGLLMELSQRKGDVVTYSYVDQ